ncbi:ABC transporter permease subunit [Sporosarcina luteola]|uniref:ABC transporter permease subunit n=1 Tax=Sporosarcina luteola TaxID=582850 RepID=UPI002040EE78|nr:ABC transporter permease subunit [Sporosarcina luteola]MCM3712350.1 ABC transporter permease subunit [Sporosarcina luteola]
MKLLRFELKKIWRKKLFLLFSLITVVCIGSGFYSNVLMQEEIAKRAFKELEPNIQAANMLRQDYDNKVSEVGMTDSVQEGYDNMVAMNKTVNEWEEAIRQRDWDSIPLIKQRFLQTIVQQNSYGYKYGDHEEEQLEQDIEKTRILVDLNLPYEDTFYSLSSFNFLKQAASLFLSLYGILFLILLFGDLFIVEMEQQTIRTLYTQPLRRLSILVSKLISVMVAAVSGLVLFVVVALLIPQLAGGKIGSIHYPILILHNDGFSYITIFQYMIKHIYLFMIVSFFAFCLVIFFSSLLRQRFLTLLSSLLFITGAVILTEQIGWLQSAINPFFYFRFGELIERTELLGHFYYSVVVIGYGFFLLVVSYLIEVKGLSVRTDNPALSPFRKGKTLKAKQLVWGLVIFELRKVRRQKRIKQMFLLLLISIIAGFIVLNYTAEQKQVNRMKTLEEAISWSKAKDAEYLAKIDELEETLKDLKDVKNPTEEQKASIMISQSFLTTYRTFVNYNEVNREAFQGELEAYDKQDWPTYYDLWIERNLSGAGVKKTHNTVGVVDNRPTERIGISDFTNKASVAEKELLAERDLQPVFNLEYISTIHDRFPNPMDKLEWNRSTLKIDSTGLFYLYTFYNSNIFLVLLAVFILFFGIGFTEEKGKQRTISLIATQPLPKSVQYLSKMVLFVLAGFLTAGFALLFMTLLGTIGKRFGDWNFPVLHYDPESVLRAANYTGIVAEEGGFHFINMGRYVVESSILFIGVTLFVLALSFLISLFFNNTIVSLLVTSVILVGGAAASASSPLASIAHLLPFTYLNVANIVNGEAATLANNAFITSNLGICVLLIGTIMIMGCGVISFKRMKLI